MKWYRTYGYWMHYNLAVWVTKPRTELWLQWGSRMGPVCQEAMIKILGFFFNFLFYPPWRWEQLEIEFITNHICVLWNLFLKNPAVNISLCLRVVCPNFMRIKLLCFGPFQTSPWVPVPLHLTVQLHPLSYHHNKLMSFKCFLEFSKLLKLRSKAWSPPTYGKVI